MRFIASKLALAAAVTMVAASSAAADDGRRHVMTPSQKIDMVRDLPDIGAFEKDGVYYDLGYIYPIHTVNGASVAGGSGEQGFVLYNNDRYLRADSGVMSDLELVLGEDPTQGYTPPKASSGASAAGDPWGVNGSSDAAKGDPIAAAPAGTRRRGSGVGLIGALFFLFIILFARVRLFRDLVIGGMLAGIAAIVRRRSEPDFSTGRDVGPPRQSSQAAAQLARLDSLAGGSAASSGGFGRKGI